MSRKDCRQKHSVISYIKNFDEKEFDYDIVINLCGEPISCRWSKTKKKEIYDSRVKITQKLTEKIINSEKTPKLFISGSAIGYYCTSSTQIFQEKTLPTNQNLFSQKVCFDCEEAAKIAEDKTRLVIIRTGVVIGQNGGIIKKMLLPFKLGLGGKIASGNQPMSWIHLEDEIGAIIHIINNSNISGVVNLCTESSTTNSEFSMQLAKSLQRPCLFTIPSLSMKLIYGEMADELLLAGQKVYPKTLLESDYRFKFTKLESAINQTLSKQ